MSAPRGPIAALLGAAPALVLVFLFFDPPASFGQAQPAQQMRPVTASGSAPVAVDVYAGGNPASELLRVPATTLYPGTVPVGQGVQSPVGDDPDTINRGMRYFDQFNCSGCHAANGGGGMGPALSNHLFIYGDQPAQIYLSIVQGRGHGMPAWGGLLPDTVVWDLAAYIKSLSQEPTSEWGTTTSLDAFRQLTEQIPAEYNETAEPWQHTERFGFGQPPGKKLDEAPAAVPPEGQ